MQQPCVEGAPVRARMPALPKLNNGHRRYGKREMNTARCHFYMVSELSVTESVRADMLSCERPNLNLHGVQHPVINTL